MACYALLLAPTGLEINVVLEPSGFGQQTPPKWIKWDLQGKEEDWPLAEFNTEVKEVGHL